MQWLCSVGAFAASGCALLYFPILLTVPFQPLIRLAVKVAARYGPLLLLLVEATPEGGVPGGPGALPGSGPRVIMAQGAVREIDKALHAAAENPAVCRVIVVDAEKCDEEWLAREVSAIGDGARVRGVLVDSRAALARGEVDAAALDALAARGIDIAAMPGRAHEICAAGDATRRGRAPAYALLAGASANELAARQ